MKLPEPSPSRCLPGAALLLLVSMLFAATSARAAEVRVPLDLAGGSRAPEPAPYPPGGGEWAAWAGLHTGTPLTVDLRDTPLAVRVTRRGSGFGVGVANVGGEAVRVRLDLRLPAGMWRFDAALAGQTARAWRMESVLRQDVGVASKPVVLPAGATLYLRVEDVLAVARSSYRQVLEAKDAAGPGPFQTRLGRALAPVEEGFRALDPLVQKPDRQRIAERTHRLLLAAAQAQATWKNGRGEPLSRRDAAFDNLMVALSEISCAAYNLVPAQTESVRGDGVRVLTVSVTNAGPRTVPLVSLGLLSGRVGAALSDGVDLFVSDSLGPGDRISATFPAAGESSVGIVQFIVGHGAAVVPARPLP